MGFIHVYIWHEIILKVKSEYTKSLKNLYKNINYYLFNEKINARINITLQDEPYTAMTA